VWAHDDDVKCVHPGWPLLTGWDAVRESWHAIFANTQEMRFTVSDVRVVQVGDLGWVTCTENILSDVRGRVAVTAILATNLFVRDAAGWRMIHHHASHVMGPAPAAES
jgi:ketosteroid isomerase-like protein